MKGYAGRILRVNLTDRSISSIDTEKYESWGGGHGIGSALFFDLAADKSVDGFHPGNVVTMMTSPLSGTMVPGSASRTEVQGIGVQSYPVGWFTRSNFGGRFAPMLKYSGWDGIAIEGASAYPVWLDIRDQEVNLRDASALWGKDTRETQHRILEELAGDPRYGGWTQNAVPEGRPTQRPAIVAIGPAGENLCRVASLVHDAGHGSGQGGFGAVFGSKKLKAISVIGTGSITIADPQGLLEARLWAKRHYSFNVDDPEHEKSFSGATYSQGFGAPPIPAVFWHRPKESRPSACIGCHSACRNRHGSGMGSESTCATAMMYGPHDLRYNSSRFIKLLFSALEFLGQTGMMMAFYTFAGRQGKAAYAAADLAQRYGVNSVEILKGINYLKALYQAGVIGPGRQIDCDLPFEKIGSMEFAEKLIEMIAYKKGAGADMAEGFYRASMKWGRFEEDINSGLLDYPCWGLPDHYDVRVHLEWGYGTILGDRDINEHDFLSPLWQEPCLALWQMRRPPLSAEELVQTISGKLAPYQGDPMMLEFGVDNMYSEHIVKLVAWHRHYSRFWKQSALYCNFLFADFCNPSARDKKGLTGEGEPRFYNAVTGKGISFEEGMELGRKIWNLDNAIWTLQGRHRDMVHFAPYIYAVPFRGVGSLAKYYLPQKKKGLWKYLPVKPRAHDRERFEEWKTKYYLFEGWDPDTGWPRRKTLEEMGLGFVAEILERNGKIGKPLGP